MELNLSIDMSGLIGLIEDIKANLTIDHLLKDSGLIIRQDVSDQFFQQGDPEWAPLSPQRLRIRARKNSTNLLTLIDSGLLITTWVSTESSAHVELFTTEGLVVGTSLERAAILHGGGQNSTGNMVPARPIVFRDDMLQLIASSVLSNMLENT